MNIMTVCHELSLIPTLYFETELAVGSTTSLGRGSGDSGEI